MTKSKPNSKNSKIGGKQMAIIIIGVIFIVVIIAVIVIMKKDNISNSVNFQTFEVVNNKIETFNINGLQLVTNNNDGQTEIIITNLTDKDIYIDKILIELVNKENVTDKLKIQQNQNLGSYNTTNITLAYDIKDMKKISFAII